MSATVEPKPLSAVCPDPIGRGWLRNDWHDLTFVHWPYPPEVLELRWPSSPGAATRISVAIGEQIEPDDLDVFLTARWGTVARRLGRLWFHAVGHEPWTLHQAELIELDDTAITAAGFPAPSGAPIVRWAQPVHARFRWPVRV